jgi:RNA-binding protein YlmH
VIVPSFIDSVGVSSPAELFSEERERQFVDIVSAYAADDGIGIVPISVTGSGFSEFSHRHYMGSILSLGIEREVMGDIAVTGKCSAFIFVSDTIAPYICESLTKIGRDSVTVSVADIPDDFTVPHEFEKKTLVAASDRVDSIVASITNLSRADAKEYCLTGLVEINYVTVTEADKRLSPGDKISVRGYGKYIIDAFTGETRSGRARISVRKYI